MDQYLDCVLTAIKWGSQDRSSSAWIQVMFSVTPLLRLNPLCELKAQCGRGLSDTQPHDTGFSELEKGWIIYFPPDVEVKSRVCFDFFLHNSSICFWFVAEKNTGVHVTRRLRSGERKPSSHLTSGCGLHHTAVPGIIPPGFWCPTPI